MCVLGVFIDFSRNEGEGGRERNSTDGKGGRSGEPIVAMARLGNRWQQQGEGPVDVWSDLVKPFVPVSI